jgi:hypothetical protein
MLMQIPAVFRCVLTLPVISPVPTSFGSASEIVSNLGDRKGIEIGVRYEGRRLRVDEGPPGGFARMQIDGFVKPSGLEGMEIAAFFGSEAAFFLGCCPEPLQS